MFQSFVAKLRPGANDSDFHLTLTNDLPSAQVAEVRLAGLAVAQGVKLTSPDGGKLWRVTIPANGSVELRYSIPTARGRLSSSSATKVNRPSVTFTSVAPMSR